jgi:lipoate-protein ligase A
VLDELVHWDDPEPRDGFENMAIDQWLAESMEMPVLRTYRWQPGWGSFGYFIPRSELPSSPPRWVRRWSGGGIVDHSRDRTYTLFVPRSCPLAVARGAESYRIIHAAVVATLIAGGIDAHLSGDTASLPGGECFVRPVEYDVLDSYGRKIAGAGQRRTVRGLLHQGSVIADGDFQAAVLAGFLARKVDADALQAPAERVMELALNRYRHPNWLERR